MASKNKNAQKKCDTGKKNEKDSTKKDKSGSGVSVKVRHILCEKQVN